VREVREVSVMYGLARLQVAAAVGKQWQVCSPQDAAPQLSFLQVVV